MATVTFGSYLKWESLLHFMRTDLPRLDRVAPAIWAEAASVMLHLPDPAGEDFEAAVKLVARVAAEKPRAAEEALRGALKDTDNQGATFTRKLREAWNRRLTRIALDFIDGGQLATPVARDVLSSLLLHGHREARDYVFKSLKRGLDGPDPQRRVAIASAQAVVATGGAPEFERVWPLIEADVAAGLEILGADSPHSESASLPFLDRIREAQVADVFLWLAQNRPKRARHPFGYVGPDERLEELERHCLDRLRTAGTVEAVDEIARIRLAMPDITWLEITEDEAQRAMRAALGDRPSALDVLRMADDRSKRYLSCEEDLLATVLSSLEGLDAELTNNDPLARFLWNLTPHEPRDEIDLSIFVTGHLRRDLRRYGVILNREVNISRISRTDIRVEAVTPGDGGQRSLALTIEVKGSWHPNLMTSMETQLRDQYLATPGAKVGLYLVGWFRSGNDLGKGGPALSVDEARGTFEAQATRLSVPPYLVRSFVLDCTWREEMPAAKPKRRGRAVQPTQR